MSTTFIHAAVGELMAEDPAPAAVFERLGIDYSCGGATPLDEARANKGLDVSTVTKELNAATRAPARRQRNWSKKSLAKLAEHIEKTHHASLPRELPRLDELTQKVAAFHGKRHPELLNVRNRRGFPRRARSAHIEGRNLSVPHVHAIGKIEEGTCIFTGARMPACDTRVGCQTRGGAERRS